MQRIAAYLLERTDELQWPDARKAEGKRIRSMIEAWLKEKGAQAPSAIGDGAYAAVDGSDARYRVLTESDGDRSWTMFELTEISSDGRRFVANLSVTVGQKNVVLFVTLEVGAVSTQVNRIEVDPRCPKVVRDLLGQPGTWHHGASRLRGLSKVEGFDAGETLALEIQNTERTIPLVVVSRLDGEPVLGSLDEKLAYDLAGVANVYSVDQPPLGRSPIRCESRSPATRVRFGSTGRVFPLRTNPIGITSGRHRGFAGWMATIASRLIASGAKYGPSS
jgi:hypothetical protein